MPLYCDQNLLHKSSKMNFKNSFCISDNFMITDIRRRLKATVGINGLRYTKSHASTVMEASPECLTIHLDSKCAQDLVP